MRVHVFSLAQLSEDVIYMYGTTGLNTDLYRVMLRVMVVVYFS